MVSKEKWFRLLCLRVSERRGQLRVVDGLACDFLSLLSRSGFALNEIRSFLRVRRSRNDVPRITVHEWRNRPRLRTVWARKDTNFQPATADADSAPIGCPEGLTAAGAFPRRSKAL